MTASDTGSPAPVTPCLCPPVPEVFTAIDLLNAAADAHLRGEREVVGQALRAANLPAIRAWTDALWGKSSPYVKPRIIAGAPPHLPKEERIPLRMPTSGQKRLIEMRDGFHCRFCGVPVIPVRVRDFLRKTYPELALWGRTNISQHAALQALWAQYDHVVPHSRGGGNELDNIVLTCAPCNYARMQYLCEELGLEDPRHRPPVHTHWDGLTRLLG